MCVNTEKSKESSTYSRTYHIDKNDDRKGRMEGREEGRERRSTVVCIRDVTVLPWLIYGNSIKSEIDEEKIGGPRT